MKLNLSTVDIPGLNCPNGLSSYRESQPAREERMRAFWNAPENRQIWKVGKLLSQKHERKTLAQYVISEGIELDKISINGNTLPLEPGFKLSLDSILNWGCPACHSAHGSGVWPSTSVNAGNLERCEFYYNPETRLLFTISKTCWDDYVEKLGAVSRFVEVPSTTQKISAESSSQSDLVSEAAINHLVPAVGRDASMLPSLDTPPVPPLPKAVRPPPATPGKLRELTNAGLYTKGLAKQASAAIPRLLNRFESYQKECARQGCASCLLMAGGEPPFILDQVRCREWNDAANELNDYFRKFGRIVDPADVRRTVANHFRGLGFRVNLIPDPHQVRISHLGWLFRWFMPRDTVQVIW